MINTNIWNPVARDENVSGFKQSGNFREVIQGEIGRKLPDRGLRAIL